MHCPDCDSTEIDVLGLTDDAKTRLHCNSCGVEWEHGHEAEVRHKAGTGGSKHHCPVCAHLYSDPSAPIVAIGTPSKTGHRCDRTKTYQLGATYGLIPGALVRRLEELSDGDLAGWPRVLEVKHELGLG